MITILRDCIVLNELTLKDANTLHLYPNNDLRLHVLHETCWCKPRVECEIDGYICIHNSLDGREPYERGERKKH